MVSFGEAVDRVVGLGSHLLHGVRGAGENTVGDLGPYLDAPLEVMYPEPAVPRDVKRRRARLTFGKDRVTEILRWHSQHVVLCPHYRTRHAGEYWLNQRVTARWIHPKAGPRRRALLYVHGWLEPGSWVEEATLLPLWYRELGVDTAHVQLPFHGRRRPKGQLFHGEWFWTADLVRSLESVRQAVCDVRSAILYFREHGYEEVGVTGLSLGGSITMLTACVEEGPDYVVPMIAHLALSEAVEDAGILWRMKTDLERFGLDRARRKELFSRIRIGDAKPVLPPSRQLWVAAKEDAYLRAELVAKQAKEWGDPSVLWIDGGHMTFPLALDRIVGAMKQMPKLAVG